MSPQVCNTMAAWDYSPWLVIVTALSDVGVAFCYYAIAGLIWYRWRQSSLSFLIPYFAPFIVSCGSVHLVECLSPWNLLFIKLSIFKILTFGVSFLSFLALWRYLPDSEVIGEVTKIITLEEVVKDLK